MPEKTFAYKWIGNRNPTSVEFPDGTVKKVFHIVGNTIMFTDDTSGTFIRTIESPAHGEQAIIVIYEES